MKPDGSKYRILLVEDDTSLAEIYKLRLETEGFEVNHCADGEQALSTALQFHPDLVLLDIMMPKISGFDVLDILRQTPETANAKIIVLTALSRPDDKIKAKALGADEFMVKSQIVISDIIERIRQHLGIPTPPAPPPQG
jgi:DNA-binding response OmpR family regulator